MREWSLTAGDPLSLTLASDARINPTDYPDDQIWEFSPGGGEPPSLAMQTTFGLRARNFRIFPRFGEADLSHTDPLEFSCQPVIRRLFPNFISLDFAPFPDIDVTAEIWVPAVHMLACRYNFVNNGSRERKLSVEIIGLLTPTSGQRMAPVEIEATRVLAGQTGNLYPVILMTGGPEAGVGSYPALQQRIALGPGSTHSLTWTQSARQTIKESFEGAREIAARNWDAELTYLEMLNASQIEIFTGNPDWDIAFMLAQRSALNLLVGPNAHLPNLSFILSRQPDQGYSIRGDGSDFTHLRNGQPALEAYHLAGFFLPGATNLARQVFQNYLEIQEDDGFIDWKPGLAGQRSAILASPVLANLAWRIYEVEKNTEFLAQAFPALLKFYRAWFLAGRDRDNDGIPEWDHLSQSGIEDHPSYSRWYEWSQGIDISTAESPALSAFLYQEGQCLIQIGATLGMSEEVAEIQTITEKLRLAVEISWDAEQGMYHDVDRDSHFCTVREVLGEINGPGTLWVNRKFEQPVRLLIHIESADGMSRRPNLVIHGISATGQPRLEKISDDRFKWLLGRGIYTGERIYQAIEQIESINLLDGDRVIISTAGYDQADISALLPLWAGIPDAERAGRLVEQTIANPARFWRPYGLPVCMNPPTAIDAIVCQSANLIWNSLIGAGLVHYGYQEVAAELVTHLMNAVIRNLKMDHAFRQNYHAETGQGAGEYNSLQGLAPLELFLDVLGVRFISTQQVKLAGINPFPWPITVKYRGLTVLRLRDKSTVIFPDGQTVTIEDPAPQIVTLRANQD